MSFIYSLLALIVFAALLLLTFLYLLPEQTLKIKIYLERKKARLSSKKTNIGDDLEVSYLEGGSGENIVLLHGFDVNKDMYLNFAKYLTPKYHVVIPDFIGFGDSSHPKSADYSPQEQAKRLHKFLQALKINSAHFVGNSMGGQIAVVYASNFEKNVKSLLLVSPSGIWSDSLTNKIKNMIETDTNTLIVKSADDFKELYNLTLFKAKRLPKPIYKAFAKEMINNAELSEKIFKSLFEYSVEEDLKKIKVKTLILFGEYDKIIIPQTADEFEKLLENSSKVILPDTGHAATYERPKVCAEIYLKFLYELSSKS